MHYFISSIDPASKFIDITLTIDNISDDTLELHLPSWRPGRYELGNFAKPKHIFHVDSFPLLSIGKVDKITLVRELTHE